MKKLVSVFLVLMLMVSCCGCNNSTDETPIKAKDYKIALVCNFTDTIDDGVGVDIFNSIKEFYSSKNHHGKKYHPQNDSAVNIINCIEGAINDGYDVICVIGDDYGNAVSSVAAQYPNTIFVIFGMKGAIALHNNVYCCNLNQDYLSFYNSILK